MQVLDSSVAISVTPDVMPVICDSAPPKRLEQPMREACAVRHYSRRTFQAYWHWSKRFILCSNCLTPDACYLRGQCGHNLRESAHLGAATRRAITRTAAAVADSKTPN